jgi:hypothetical protein
MFKSEGEWTNIYMQESGPDWMKLCAIFFKVEENLRGKTSKLSRNSASARRIFLFFVRLWMPFLVSHSQDWCQMLRCTWKMAARKVSEWMGLFHFVLPSIWSLTQPSWRQAVILFYLFISKHNPESKWFFRPLVTAPNSTEGSACALCLFSFQIHHLFRTLHKIECLSH